MVRRLKRSAINDAGMCPRTFTISYLLRILVMETLAAEESRDDEFLVLNPGIARLVRGNAAQEG